jgi:hypothetical protein
MARVRVSASFALAEKGVTVSSGRGVGLDAHTVASQWVTAFVHNVLRALDGVAAPLLHGRAVDVLPLMLHVVPSAIGRSTARGSPHQKPSS